jgi:DivIVA domain-containing protein
MEMNPQRVRSAEFKTVRKGVDPEEVRVFLDDVASELERAQNQATAMEARARAAVARLQEVTENATSAPAVDASAEESETISRTLLLAQRTADSTIADAKAAAARVIGEANDEAARTKDSTREMAAKMIEDARNEARQVAAAERVAIAEEVEALKARRDFLESDVTHLETFLADQRSRVREVASSLIDLTERVPDGLGEVRAPLLSASDDDESGEPPREDPVVVTDFADQPEPGPVDAEDVTPEPSGDEKRALDVDPWADDAGIDRADDPTEAIPVVGEEPTDRGDEFRFSFDDDRS